MLARHPRSAALTASVSPAAEEVLAALLGALALEPGSDRDALVEKATFEVLKGGTAAEAAARLIGNLWYQLGAIL